MKKFFSVILFAVVAMSSAYAQQTVVQNKDLDNFSSVVIGDKFSFRLKSAPNFAVRIIADDRIIDYVRPTVKNGVFTISLNEKKYPAELKKALKAKGASEPFLEIEISAPNVKSLEIKDKAMLLAADPIRVDEFTFKASGSSKVSRIDVDCVSANLEFHGSSQCGLNVNVDTKLNISTENSSVANISQNGGNSILKTKGSSTLNLKVEVVDVDIEAAGGSTIYLSGNASMIDLEATGGSLIDAEALEVREGNFIQSGSSKCHANVAERMKVNLTGGCMLTFKRKPMIEVDRIVNSTLIKADDPKRK